MKIIEYGNRNPKLNRILISGSALTGKTVTAAKFASSPERAFFISTDHNAINQGYRGIKFEFPKSPNDMMKRVIESLDLAESAIQTWDVLIIDLTEDFDERYQSLLRPEFDKAKDKRAVWGKITSLYKDMQTMLMTRFTDRTIIFLTREVDEEIKNKWGDVLKVNHYPALRETLRNQLLKDQDAEIRLFFDERGNRQIDTGRQRYPENERLLNEILNRPLPTFKLNTEAPHKPVKNMATGNQTSDNQPPLDDAPSAPPIDNTHIAPPVGDMTERKKAEQSLPERIGKMIIGAENKASDVLQQETLMDDQFKSMIMNSSTFEAAQKLVKKWAEDLGL